MSKTREIEVWYKLPNEETKDFACYDHEPRGRPDLWRFKKTKLVIELPEKKIEITESRLEEIFNRFYSNNLCNSTHVDVYKIVKEELFSGEA